MVHVRHDRIARIAESIDDVEVDDPSGSATTLVIGWGSTYGAIDAAVARLRATGDAVARAHLVHINPFPANLGEVLARYDQVLVPELNLGQLTRLLRAEYVVDAKVISKVQGLPFRASELESAIRLQLGGAR
jgi:2-oxoglutarate ferredoxin oxidoreductase subunit alpha